MRDGVRLSKRGVDWFDVIIGAVLILLAVSLTLTTVGLRAAQSDAKDAREETTALQEQVSAGDELVNCIRRFANEDERVDRARTNWVVIALVALAGEDDARLAESANNARLLADASLQANAERGAAHQICTDNPAAEPTSHTIPELPPR